jgi:hypothetical protein
MRLKSEAELAALLSKQYYCYSVDFNNPYPLILLQLFGFQCDNVCFKRSNINLFFFFIKNV